VPRGRRCCPGAGRLAREATTPAAADLRPSPCDRAQRLTGPVPSLCRDHRLRTDPCLPPHTRLLAPRAMMSTKTDRAVHQGQTDQQRAKFRQASGKSTSSWVCQSDLLILRRFETVRRDVLVRRRRRQPRSDRRPLMMRIRGSSESGSVKPVNSSPAPKIALR
jgi:hypothetical protein